METTKSIIKQVRKKRQTNVVYEKKLILEVTKELAKKYDFSSENKRSRTDAEKKILDILDKWRQQKIISIY